MKHFVTQILRWLSGNHGEFCRVRTNTDRRRYTRHSRQLHPR